MLDELIEELKDYTKCNDDLAIKIRQRLLEPFQPDLSQPESLRKPPPTPTDFKNMANKLAPYAMRIVNQNTKSLSAVKRINLANTVYRMAINCLIDTTFYAFAALKHMNTYNSIEPKELAKSVSNMICKMVELGEYDRSLDELKKLRSQLASLAQIQLIPCKAITAKIKPASTKKNVLAESNVNQTNPPPPVMTFKTQWESDMINKYQDLFQFPSSPNMKDKTIILLVIAYQMNVIRCWSELKDGSLAKFLPQLLEEPGNYFEWCMRLFDIDKDTAKQQLVTLQRVLYSVANKMPLTEDSAYVSYNIQVLALKALKLSKPFSLKLILDRMVRIGITYDKATKHTLYSHIEMCCNNFLEGLEPFLDDFDEVESYIVLCEYYAYISNKARSYKGSFYAYKFILRALRSILEDSTRRTFFYTAYGVFAKLSLGAVQMDKMVTNNTFADIKTTFTESMSLLKFAAECLEQPVDLTLPTNRALFNMWQSIERFKQSAGRLYEYVLEKAKQELAADPDDVYKTPPRQGELITPSSHGEWSSSLVYLNGVLEKCGDVLDALFPLITQQNSSSKYVIRSPEVSKSYVDTMILLARMEFNVNDEDTYQKAYEHLSSAELMCATRKFITGYRWISGCYYGFGVDLLKAKEYDHATYPIRKSCTMLEKDTERASSEEGRIQLCKRYECLGVCSQKNTHFREAVNSYRLALKRIPVSLIEDFVSKANTTAVSTLMEQETLIPKLMDHFLTAAVVDPELADIEFASERMNLSTLDEVQKCIIYECELKLWNVLALKMNVSKFQISIINKLLEFYDATRYPIRRARVILNRLRVERRQRQKNRENCLKAAIASANEVLQLLKRDDYQQDANLLSYRIHYIASANSWIAICGRELRQQVPNTFRTTLQQWGALLKKITPIYNSSGSSKQDIEQVYNSIDDIDQFYDHLRMLADLFAISGEYVYQICVLRMLLKLNNGLRNAEEDHISESIKLSSVIGRIYCDLGYTGKASVEFNQARLAIANRPCSHMAELVYRLHYAYYLTCISDYESSRDAFKSAKIVWQHIPSDDIEKSQTTVKSYVKRCMLLANAYFTLAKIQANTETLDLAIENATGSLQLLNKCIKVLDTAHKEKQASGERSQSNPLMPSPPPEPRRVVYRETQWEIAHKMGQCFHYLAYLYIQKGAWKEGVYFVKQGPLLAEKVNSSFMLFNSALCASDYYLRCGDLSTSQDYFEKASQWQSKGSYHHLDEAKLKSLMAHLALANQYHDIALETYDGANDILEKISQPEYVANLEVLVHGENNKNSKVTFEDEKHEPFDCVPLQQLQSANKIQMSKAMAQKGDVQSALLTLEQLEESDFAIDQIIELNALISQWKLLAIEDELYQRKNTQVALLPSMKIQVARGTLTKRNTTSKNLGAIQENLTNLIERMLEAYRIGFTKERVAVVQSLCRQLGTSMFSKEHIALSQSRMLVSNHAVLSTYYMSMANDVTTRREMQNCLKIKTNILIPGHLASDSAWPAMEEDERAEQYGKHTYITPNPKWLQAHLETLSELYREEHELDDKQFQEKFVNILPEHWTVCSISVDPVHQDVYAMQLRANETPFVAKLPMNRAQLRSNQYTAAVTFEEAQAELKDIIDKSDETIHISKSCIDPAQVKSWWMKRTELDNRLKTLLEDMEGQWLSGFKGLMTGRFYEYKEELVKFQKGLNDAVYKFVNLTTPAKKPVEFSLNFCRLFFKLGRRPNNRDLEDLAYYTLGCYENQGIEFDYSKIDTKQLTDQMKVLVNRYHEKSSMAGVQSTKTIPNEHVILIVDRHIQAFPIESMPLLRTQSASRLPSLSLLRDRILYAQAYNTRTAFEDFGITSTKDWKEFTVSKKSAYYVLNPGGDLKDTQKEFETIFKSVPEWNGTMRVMPREFQCKEALETKDIYMYFGHSAGQAFMRGTTVRQLPSCAVSLLMGCSSGVLNSSGEFDPYGYVLNFLLAGSPTIVANLWDVTDKSIDRLTKCMLNSWGLLKSKAASKSLVQAAAESRNACKLPYLIGAAPVVYGIPVYLDNSQ